MAFIGLVCWLSDFEGVRMGEDQVRSAFREQGRYCVQLGSPFTAQLCTLLADRLDRTSKVGRTVLDWPGEPDAKHDVLPLRLAGGLHALARSGMAPGLADVYPPHAVSDDAFWAVLEPVLSRFDDHLRRWLRSAPQTNEVRRSSLLMAGLSVVADRTGLPIRAYELGASMGLNLVLDRYAHRLGGLVLGDSRSPLVLEPAWTGSRPPEVQPVIVDRAGVDLAPLNPSDAGDRDRLMAYIWADQTDRLERTAQAIAVASADPPPIVAADAAEWLEGRLATHAAPGTACVVMHTIAFQYFNATTKARVDAALRGAGAAAGAQNPLAWLSFEMGPDGGPAELRLRLWPSGTDMLLATADPHGARVHWLHEAAQP